MQRHKRRRTVIRHCQQAVPETQVDKHQAHDPGPHSMYETSVDINAAVEDGEDDEGGLDVSFTGQPSISSYRISEGNASLSGGSYTGSPAHGSSAVVDHAGSLSYEDAAMTDAASSDGSTPWLDYLRSLDSPSNTNLPFGLHFADTLPGPNSNAFGSGSSHADSSDAGGAAIENPDLGSHAEQTHNNESVHTHPTNLHVGTQADATTTFSIQPGLNFTEDFLDFIENTALAHTGLPFGFVGDYTAPNPWTQSNDTSDQPWPDSMPGQPIDPHSPAFLDDDMPPIVPSTVSMGMGCYNVGLVNFLRLWAHRGEVGSKRSHPPDIREVRGLVDQTLDEVTYNDLKGDQCDFQGINWEHMGTTRTAARAHRQATYRNYVNRLGSDRWMVSLLILNESLNSCIVHSYSHPQSHSEGKHGFHQLETFTDFAA